MATKLSLNSIAPSVLEVKANAGVRGDIVSMGQLLAYDHARRGRNAMNAAMNIGNMDGTVELTPMEYKKLNAKFQEEHLVYCAKLACDATGMTAPETFADFKKQGMNFATNRGFLNVLQGLYQEIVNPIIPAVYSEAVSNFADVVEVGFAETYAVSVESNDICLFQDSAWGASRSVPANRLYAKDYTLNPTPRTAQVNMKWHQLVGNGTDFGAYFANIVAGMYAKTMGLFNEMLAAAASNTAQIPTGLIYNFSSVNWVTLANKLAAVNNTSMDNIVAYGNAVALSKVLPTQVTGSTNVNMDAAIATLLGRDYVRDAQLGEYMRVRLMALQDAVIPGTQNNGVTTVLDATKVWMMAANRRKPMVIAYNSATPITIEIDPLQNAAFEFVLNVTTALDAVSVVSSKLGYVNI